VTNVTNILYPTNRLISVTTVFPGATTNTYMVTNMVYLDTRPVGTNWSAVATNLTSDNL